MNSGRASLQRHRPSWLALAAILGLLALLGPGAISAHAAVGRDCPAGGVARSCCTGASAGQCGACCERPPATVSPAASSAQPGPSLTSPGSWRGPSACVAGPGCQCRANEPVEPVSDPDSGAAERQAKAAHDSPTLAPGLVLAFATPAPVVRLAVHSPKCPTYLRFAHLLY